jgi:endosialidase-like protein
MRHFNLPYLAVIVALSSISLRAGAAQPPDSVNSDSYGNTATGTDALLNLPTSTQYNYSVDNTASGLNALHSNTTGANNTAYGANALFSNTVGKGNEAHGVNALYSNTTGIRNLGVGSNALYDNVSGSYNIALGFDAGYNVTTGSNNILIGAPGLASDNGTIQIGAQGTQTSTSVAGIYGVPVTGSAVYVTSAGQLGVQASSERYKTDIAAMPEVSVKLAQLRPVTFHYRTDPQSIQQYGLIAEEVDKIYPELVIREPSGKIQGVHYEELAPMLLSEVQKQRIELQELQTSTQTQSAKINEQSARISDLTQQVAKLSSLENEIRAALLQLQSEEQRVAQR